MADEEPCGYCAQGRGIEEQLIADGFKRVYVGSEWYDAPRVGLADVDGKPYYLRGDDYDHADDSVEYGVWPASGGSTPSPATRSRGFSITGSGGAFERTRPR
ncbi:hypothetical protein ACFYPN_07075 [Streptomyces sp. NPDC005576]|uniref:hypothetical protein n=1 Tax=Streptomyces sp. NPDC005576 TaxID=3364726 RepID=UPI0036CD71A6